MPYTIRKSKCKQTDGDQGRYVMSYTDNKGRKHRNCHTSRAKARAQISAIEMPEGIEELEEGWIPLASQIAELLEEELARLAGSLQLESGRGERVRSQRALDYARRIGFTHDPEEDATVEQLISGIMRGELAPRDVPHDLVPAVARGLRDEGERGLAVELIDTHLLDEGDG